TTIVAALLWLDWMHMFPAEASRIWGRKFTGTTAVYLLNRYTALAERVIFIVETLVWWSLETISIATNVASEGIFLVLTWIRTYGIARDCSRLGLHSPLTTLLLRDGEPFRQQ
ncbi:hypothetical protein L226DRAFT_472503, partial [Lentinus tigrinus ALCF2SS1-7]|uniref:uncharacterized protein n=1 Tax=Lentinus tigrinus ALCF2SS1-7 TaxID=1328758 RepID=UPI001165E6AB